jgi:hypothetical protein
MTLIPSSIEILDIIQNTDEHKLSKDYYIKCLEDQNIFLNKRQIKAFDRYKKNINSAISLNLNKKQIRESKFSSMEELKIYFDTILSSPKDDDLVSYLKNTIGDPSDNAKKWIEEYSDDLLKDINDFNDKIIQKAEKSKKKVRIENTEKYKKYFRALHAVIQLVSEAFFDINENVSSDDKKEEALVRLLGDSCHVAQEINILLLNGFPDGAFARWRKLYEITVILSFLEKNDDLTSERYLDYFHIENYRSLNKFKENPILQDDFYQLNDETIYENYQAVIDKYGETFGKKYGWASHIITRKRGVTFQTILNETNFKKLSYYYQISCSQVHVDSMGMIYKLGLPSHSENNILLGSSSYGLKFPIELTTISLLQIIAIISSSLNNYKAILTAKIINKLFKQTYIDNSHRGPEPSSG